MSKNTWVSVIKNDNVDGLEHAILNCCLGVRDKTGDTALHAAFQKQAWKCVDYLLTAGVCDVNMKCKRRGQSALHYACETGNAKYIYMLLEKKASPLLKDKAGYTALMIYIAYGHHNLQVIDALLKHGADITSVGSNGKSIMDLVYAPITFYVVDSWKFEFGKAMCRRGAWYSRTKHEDRHLIFVVLRQRLSNCKAASLALKRVLKKRGVHKDVIPFIVALVWETKEDDRIWKYVSSSRPSSKGSK